MLEECAACSTAYAVGLAACPHCGSTEVVGRQQVPKIDSRGVASNASDPDPVPAAVPEVTTSDSVVGVTVEDQPEEPEPAAALPRRTRRAAPREA
jgi:uncharacterized OB-fold protein